MNLVIVESPAKRKTIQSYLGDGWQVEASVGHIRDLPSHDLGVSLNTFAPDYVPTERGKKTIAKLRSLAKNASCVWLATDPDREGEAIAWHLKEALNLSDPKRIFFNAITKSEVTAAIKSPRAIDMDLVDAQQARRVLDRLVGFQVSPALCNSVNQSGLSAGRVQSVAVRLVVDRHREINAFSSTNHFGVELSFDTDGLVWKAKWDTSKHTSEDEPYILDRSVADQISKINSLSVNSVESKQSKRHPPAPFITTTLQKAASINLDKSASQTMKDAQTLFDAGLITYHRTDNPNLSSDGAEMIRSFLTDVGHGEHIPETRNKWKSKDDAQEAHEAIRPSDILVKDVSVDDSAKALYKLIRQRAIASQMNAAIYDNKTLILSSEINIDSLSGNNAYFVAKEKSLVYSGWTLLTSNDWADEDAGNDDGEGGELPYLEKGSCLAPTQGDILALKTKAPKRYTEPALISKLEKEGIGRPSTYANILENIMRREYIVEKNKSFSPLPAGEVVVDVLANRFDFMELGFTRSMENDLDKIAKGSIQYFPVIKSFNELLIKNLHVLADNPVGPVYECPKCESHSLRRIKTQKGFFWGCSDYPACDGVMQDQNGKPVDKIESEHSCPDCGGGLFRRKNTNKNGYWWGCENWKGGCKFATDDKRGKPAKVHSCPDCGSRLRQGSSSKGKHWFCSGYKEGCNVKLDDSKGSPKLK